MLRVRPARNQALVWLVAVVALRQLARAERAFDGAEASHKFSASLCAAHLSQRDRFYHSGPRVINSPGRLRDAPRDEIPLAAFVPDAGLRRALFPARANPTPAWTLGAAPAAVTRSPRFLVCWAER